MLVMWGADGIYVKQNVEAIPLKSKKGLGGLINHEFLASDLDELGISSATINILLQILCIFLNSREIFRMCMGENLLF